MPGPRGALPAMRGRSVAIQDDGRMLAVGHVGPHDMRSNPAQAVNDRPRQVRTSSQLASDSEIGMPIASATSTRLARRLTQPRR